MKGQAITARLIVRRVKDLNPAAARGQDELFPVWRYHAVFTDSRSCCSRPENNSATTPRQSKSSPTGSAGHWLTCHIGLVPRQRRLAHLRRHQPQPAARRRVAGRPGLRQGPRGHAAPQSHRCRRPYRPPRPRRDHPAPARRMAPRTGLDEPVRSRLRPGPPPRPDQPRTGHRIPTAQLPPAHFPTATRTSRRTRASGKASTPGSLRRSGKHSSLKERAGVKRGFGLRFRVGGGVCRAC
jgi:hypothetical protein